MEAPRKSCLVVPTYNERENVRALVEAVEKVGLRDLLMLFVDDNSPDGTGEEVRRISNSRPWVRLLEREKKMGIGTAYQDGFREALASTDATVIVEMDADLQHPASTLVRLIDAVNGGADVALGSRYVAGGGISGWGRFRRVVSRGANVYARVMLGLKVKDATSGFRAFSRKAAEEVVSSGLPAKGFEFQVATLHLLKKDAKMVEVPYVFVPRMAGESKLKLWDSMRFFVAVIKLSLRG